MASLLGQTLGRYHILEQLGEGGMATVYKAYDTRLETDVAVKVIRTENLAPSVLERSLKRFEREAKSLARLTHPNIVKVTDYGEFEGKPYLVMEYLPGGTLKDRIKQGRIPWQDAVQLLLPMAEALDYAHSQNMIHRDVKPANILLTQRGQPMLTDFGIAKLFDMETTADLTGTGMGIGTPEYMAPEQWQGQVSVQTDVYALGVVFYEMLTGRKPYSADTPAALLLKQANDPLPRPGSFVKDLPEAVERVLFRALAKTPEDRYPGMGEFAPALLQLLKTGKMHKGMENSPDLDVTLDSSDGQGAATTEELLAGGEKSSRKDFVSQKAIPKWVVFAGLAVLFGLAILWAGKSLSLSTLFATPTASNTPSPTATQTPISTLTPTVTPTPLALPIFQNPDFSTDDPAVARFGHGRGYRLQFSPDDKLLAVAGSVGIWLYNVNDLSLAAYYPQSNPAYSLAFSPDGEYLAATNGQSVSVWDFNDKKLVYELEGHATSVADLDFSPDGTILASLSQDGVILLWDTGDGERIGMINTGERLEVGDSSSGIWYWRDGNSLLTRYKLVDISSSRQQYCPPVTVRAAAALHPIKNAFASFSVGDYFSVVYIVDLNVCTEIGGIVISNTVHDIDISPDGNTLVAGGEFGGADVAIFDLQESVWNVSKPATALFGNRGHIPPVVDVRYSHRGAVIASLSADGSIVLWDSDGLTEQARLDNAFATRIALSPDGSMLAGVSEFGLVRIWDTYLGRQLTSLHGCNGKSTSFSLDGKLLACSAVSNGLVFANLTTGASQASYSFEVTDWEVNSLVFTPQKETIITGGYYDLAFWNVEKGWKMNSLEFVKAGVGGHIRGLAYSADGNSLFVANGARISIVEPLSGENIGFLEGHTREIAVLTVARSEPRLASAAGEVLIWDYQSRTILGRIQDLPSQVISLAFSPDGRLLAGGLVDGSTILWDASTGEALETFSDHNLQVTSLAITPDSRLLISGSDDGIVVIRDLSSVPNLPITIMSGSELPASNLVFPTPGPLQLWVESIAGYGVTINGFFNLANTFDCDWGDGAKTECSFPLEHYFPGVGRYTITVTHKETGVSRDITVLISE